jgi:phage terminase large subunit-like protein
VNRQRKQPNPLAFFNRLVGLDGRPLLETMEPFRKRTFSDVLYTFGPDGRRKYNVALIGRAKKNFKSTDLVLAALYHLAVWASTHGNDCYIVANDEDQAADDLTLAKRLIAVNPLLQAEAEVQQKQVLRRDGRGSLRILPARDAIGMHGKGWDFLGIDEMHGYRDYSVLEAMAPDPSRVNAVQWITTYASVYNTPGFPLFDYKARGMAGSDPRMYFQWYSGDDCTDPEFAELPPEQRANPCMASWGNDDYLEQQRRRLPSHKFRRLHLNLPGAPDGAYFDPGKIIDAIVEGRRQLPPIREINGGPVRPVAFVDMSGGSQDYSVLCVCLHDPRIRKYVVLALVSQTGRPPFDPIVAVTKFAGVLKEYGVLTVHGDAYAGQTFRAAFNERGINYVATPMTRSGLYEAFEPLLNSEQVELLDRPELQEQLLGLVRRGQKIDHLPGEHDDWANACAGAVVTAAHGGARAGEDILVGHISGFKDYYDDRGHMPAPWIH